MRLFLSLRVRLPVLQVLRRSGSIHSRRHCRGAGSGRAGAIGSPPGAPCVRPVLAETRIGAVRRFFFRIRELSAYFLARVPLLLLLIIPLFIRPPFLSSLFQSGIWAPVPDVGRALFDALPRPPPSSVRERDESREVKRSGAGSTTREPLYPVCASRLALVTPPGRQHEKVRTVELSLPDWAASKARCGGAGACDFGYGDFPA